ncbi:MAG: hypothetical protein SF028_14635 [Candidatus Sumerlaeia bacterium]|nr:hypothetical protein [Candidatus Sumerlaeia bacterium]
MEIKFVPVTTPDNRDPRTQAGTVDTSCGTRVVEVVKAATDDLSAKLGEIVNDISLKIQSTLVEGTEVEVTMAFGLEADCDLVLISGTGTAAIEVTFRVVGGKSK